MPGDSGNRNNDCSVFRTLLPYVDQRKDGGYESSSESVTSVAAAVGGG